MLRRIGLRVRAVFGRRALERDMREEMEAHLARAIDRLMARGMSPEAARLAARREFGNVGVLQEEARDARGARWIESLAGDIRFALRHFARRPLSTATIVLVLALGIGGHAAVFSMVQAYTMRPAPGVPRDDALVRIRAKERVRNDGRWFSRPFSYPELRDLAELKETFLSVAGWATDAGVVNIGGDISAAQLYFVTDNYFAALGTPLAAGAGLPPSRGDSPEMSAIISHALWRDVLGGRENVIGSIVRINDVPVRVVGVAPSRFYGATQTNPGTPSMRARVFWMPLSARATVVRSSALAMSSRDSTVLHAFARLRPGVSMAEANAAVQVVANRAVAQIAPRRVRATGARIQLSEREVVANDADVVPLRGGTDLPSDNNAAMIAAVFGTVAFLILLVACTNVSALVVGAAVARRHEIAIRLSLGASRARVVRQLLTEAALLAVTGGGLGLLVFWWIAKLAATQISEVELAPDVGTIAFTLVLALGTGILFGLSPALHATRRGVADVLKDSGAALSNRSRLQRTFVVAQIVLTQPLLVGLAMLLGVIARDGGVEMAKGVDRQIVSLRLYSYFSVGTYEEKQTSLAQLRRRLEQMPGVVAVVPESQGYRLSTLVVHPEDRATLPRSAEAVSVHLEVTSPGYFKILDVPILRGRELLETDARDHAVVIGDDLARSLWGSADPIGRRLKESSSGRELDDLVVVGVFDSRVATTRGQGTRVYAAQDSRVIDHFLIRTAGSGASLVEPIRSVVREELPAMPIAGLQTLEQIAEAQRKEALQASASAAAAGLLALLLASIGLYGVVSLAVGQRRREIGIRMALGARPREVVALLFSSGVRLSVIGLFLGLPLSIVALRMLGAAVQLPDTSVLGIGFGIAAVVLAVASLATWIPARRAATVDPVLALRSE